MTKSELIGALAISTGYDKTTISNILEKTMSTIKTTVADGENVYLRGFGSFGIKVRKKKIARNISKNVSLVVPQHNIAFFKAAEDFNKMVN